MTSVQAMKESVEFWWKNAQVIELSNPPPFVTKLCHVIYKLKRDVFNFVKGTWEYEGF